MTKFESVSWPRVRRRRVGVGRCEDLAALVDDDVLGILRERDRRLHLVAVERHELALRVLVEGACARIEELAVCARDLEPAAAVDAEIELVVGLRQRALDVQVADRRRAHAEADIGAFRNAFLRRPASVRRRRRSA